MRLNLPDLFPSSVNLFHSLKFLTKKENTKETKEKEEKITEEPKWTEDIRYENYCDAFVISFRKGAFLLMFGQGVYVPPKMLVRTWTDASAMKTLSNLIQEQIKRYEEKYGKIE